MKVQCFGGRGSKRIRASKGVPIPDEAGEVGKQEPDHKDPIQDWGPCNESNCNP